jgi:two-component system sensor histidine kinase QseC
MKSSPSLLRHLLGWALGALVVIWAAFMVFGYRTGIHEADELTDGHLASVASILLAQRAGEFRPLPAAASRGDMTQLKAHDYQQSLSIVIWDAAGQVLSHSGEAPVPPFNAKEGFETLALGQPPVTWRTFSRWNEEERSRKVTVMLSLAERDELAEDIAAQVAEPGLWLLPVVALALVFAIRRGLRPLLELSHQVNALDVHRDTALQAPPHEEFKAIVQSIDKLMSRYNAALAQERELASEVAHELRTPLAALRLHAASLQYELSPEELAETRQRIVAEAERAGAVLTDLLALARASRTDLAQARETTDLADLARRVAAEFGQAALESDHDLSVEAPDSCVFSGHPVLLELALRNLIENALAHTPPGTTVRVRVLDNPRVLEVIDNGASVEPRPDTGRTRRHLGFGLGHQVVRRVADIHNGSFETSDATAGGERSYRIVLDAPAS